MNPFLQGTGLLVSELDVPVVPVKIEGLYELKRLGRKRARPGEVTLKIGEPIRFTTADAAETSTEASVEASAEASAAPDAKQGDEAES